MCILFNKNIHRRDCPIPPPIVNGNSPETSATIYRYFETKAQLAISAGIAYWQKVVGKYLESLSQIAYQKLSGLQQMEYIFHIFSEIFQEELLFLKFLQEFDIFVQRYHISKERLGEYEEYILNLKPYMTDALKKGLNDGSLYFSYNIDEVYFSVMHTMLSLMQKLSYNGSMLLSDEIVKPALQLRIAGGLLLKGLGAE